MIRVTDASGTVTSPAVTFTVEPSPRRGFIRVSHRDSRMLEYDNGDPFIPIAEGRQWAPVETRRALSYAAAFAADGSNGVNLTRIWDQNDSFNLSLEGADPGVGAEVVAIHRRARHCRRGRPHGAARRAISARRAAPARRDTSQWVAVAPSTRYRLSGWIRTQDVGGEGALFAIGGDIEHTLAASARTPCAAPPAGRCRYEFTTGTNSTPSLVWAGGVSATGTA